MRQANPAFHRFATGLDEIFGLAWKDNAFRVTQSCELTRVSDSNGDGVADRFETISDAWGYANYHEYAFGSKLDADGNQFVSLGLSESYYSHALNRGFIMKVAPDGKTTAFASGLRSPGGIGFDEHGCAVLCRKPGTVELFLQSEGRVSEQLSRSSGQLRVVQVLAGTGTCAGDCRSQELASRPRKIASNNWCPMPSSFPISAWDGPSRPSV